MARKTRQSTVPASDLSALKALAATPLEALTNAVNTAIAAGSPAVVEHPANITGFKVADIMAGIQAGTITRDAGVAELTRRINNRAAAGKHPMPFVIEARDNLLATPAPRRTRRTRNSEAVAA